MTAKAMKESVTIVTVLYSIINPSIVVLQAYILATIVDVITGILGSLSAGDKISTNKLWSGLIKKFNRYFYVLVAMCVDFMATEQFDKKITMITSSVISWMLVNELVSIVKNISSNDSFKVPEPIRKFLEDRKNDTN